MQERQTKQKAIIYEALKTLNHPTATEVYGYVHNLAPSVSRATVFRVLGGFAASGRALELRLAGNEIRYDYNVMPHYHARCSLCGKLSDVKVYGLPDEGLTATPMDDFTVEGYEVEFHGLCGACKTLAKC
ncbi:MAG: transcriptional repressor [Clostridia bacterium]|nr:transcriptional repressor [Clostridia bacterium]